MLIVCSVHHWSKVSQCSLPPKVRRLSGWYAVVSLYDRGRAPDVELFVGCLTSQQHATVSQGRICSDNFTRCHTEIEVADPTLHLTQSQYTDTLPTSPSTDPITPGAWQGSHWSANFFLCHWYDSTPEKSRRMRDSNLGSSVLKADALTTRPTRLSRRGDCTRQERSGMGPWDRSSVL